MNLGFSSDGVKEVTLLELVVHGEKRKGKGREALLWLKKIFSALLYAQDFGFGRILDGLEGSFPFWMQMFREGILEGLEGEICQIHRGMTPQEIDEMEERVRRSIAALRMDAEGA